MKDIPPLVLLRHGESLWNRENRFTGWTDIDLSLHGVEEARQAAHLLERHEFSFDWGLTSVLKRSIRTLWLVLDELDLMWIAVERDWRLNERHYGALQGLNKAETAERLGKEQVFAWRRSFSAQPPPLGNDDPRHPRFDPRYQKVPVDKLPATESLADTLERVLPVWEETIQPAIKRGERLLVVAHGNSLRALVKHLDKIPDDQIPSLNIPTGIPLIYRFDDELNVKSSEYLRS